MRFLGLSFEDRVPDAKTIWLFRDTLTKADVIKDLFAIFNQLLEAAHLITHTGTSVDPAFLSKFILKILKKVAAKLAYL